MISTLVVFRAHAGNGVLHGRPIVVTEVGHAAGEYGNTGRRATCKRVNGASNLLGGEDGCHVDLHAVARERAHGIVERLATRRCTGSLQ